MTNALTIARREFRGYFDQATAYILLVVFLFINYFFYFRSVLFTGQATLRPMFDLLPWLFLFFVPAITMRSLAEERSTGTLELVLTQPLTELEFLLGKFLGVLGFLGVALAGTLGAWIALEAGGDPFAGVMVAQYAGALLFAASLTGIGLWASSMTRNQITAFILGVAAIFLLIVIGLEVVLLGLPPALAAAAERLALLTHFDSVSRGVIDVRDVVYFLTVAAAFLALAYWSLLRQKLSPGGAAYRTLVAGTLGILGICLVVNLLGRHIRGRLDLTPGRAYTLSEATRSVLRGLDDIVTIRFFASRELPPQAGLVRRDIEDMLADYRAVAGGDLQVIEHQPSGEGEAAAEARRFGIPAIQFNVLGEEEFQVRQGYLGLALQYADAVETIPFVQRTEDLEYRLTGAIRRMTSSRRPTIAFLAGRGGPDIVAELSSVAERLREAYHVTALDLGGEEAGIADSVRVVAVAGPQEDLTSGEARRLGEFLARGGNLLVMAQPVALDPSGFFASELPLPRLAALLRRYGVSWPDGLAFDLRSNGRVTMPTSGGLSFVLPYPLWVEALPGAPHVIVDRLSSVLAPWTTPIDVASGDSTNIIPLLVTTELGGRLEGRTPLSPQMDWAAIVGETSRQLIAAALMPPAAAAAGPAAPEPAAEDGGAAVPPPTGRVVLIGDADFATNRFVQAHPDNLAFVQNAVDWLAEEESLIGIRAKSRTPPPLVYPSEAARDAAKYGSLVGIPLLFVLVGVARLLGRRRLHSRPYGSAEASR